MRSSLIISLAVVAGIGLASAALVDSLEPRKSAPPAVRAPAHFGDLPSGILLTRAQIGGGRQGRGAGARTGGAAAGGAADGAAAGGAAGGAAAGGGFGAIGKVAVAFTDTSGRPLYTLPIDMQPGKSACTGECLKKWHPAVAPPAAQPVGDWSLLNRTDDGTRQWAFRGKPLYTYINEVEFKDDPHLAPTRNPPGRLQPVAGHGVDGAIVAEAQPEQWMKLPAGTSVAEFTQAPGQVLVTASTGAPLYTFTGKPAQDRKLPNGFRSYPAAMMDSPVGDFSIRTRPDGTLQWAYRTAPLFTFDGDIEIGDVNGKDLVPGIAPALVLRYPLPKEVALQKDQKHGGRLVEATTGQTLYVRDRVYYALVSNYVRGPQRLDPAVGKAIGLSGCDAECERQWKPLLAPKDAQSRGYWTVLDRGDGGKQWAYRKYALYVHVGEPPGTLYGAETFDIAFDGGFGETPPEEHGTGLFFRAAWP